jgi:hypothetical protein
VLGSIRFSGDLGSSLGLAVAAQILAFVDGTPSTTSMPGRLVFKTQAAGSIDPNNVITALVIYRDQSVEVTGTFFADTAVNIGSNAAPTSMLTVLGPVATKIPRTLVNATETMVAADSSLIANRAGTITLTLQSAASYPGRWLYVKTIQAQTLVSATSNVVPLVGGSAGPAILAATAGKWASLQSDGANWIIMAGN